MAVTRTNIGDYFVLISNLPQPSEALLELVAAIDKAKISPEKVVQFIFTKIDTFTLYAVVCKK